MKFAGDKSTNLKPNEMFYSRIVKVSDLPEGMKEQIKSDVPIEVRINSGEWIRIEPDAV